MYDAERFRYYDDMLRTLAGMAVGQYEMTQRQVEINQAVQMTLARIETLLARMIARSDNGTEASCPDERS